VKENLRLSPFWPGRSAKEPKLDVLFWPDEWSSRKVNQRLWMEKKKERKRKKRKKKRKEKKEKR